MIMENERRTLSDTYEILEYLQSGSGGAVYKAWHKRLKQEVVLKRIKKKNVNMAVNRQEADILKNLRHMYLPQVLDFLQIDGEIYTVMSFIPGKSFKELLKEGMSFTQKQLIRWGMQLCSALNYLHSQKPPVIHGDIKPSNIMLTPQGDICLIDFNISFFLDGTTMLGYTEGYSSPEQHIIAMDAKSSRSLSKYRKIDEKSDIYSAGATLFHLATGRKPPGDGRYSAEDERILKEYVSDAFAVVILKAMNYAPERRFRNVLEMFRALQGIYKKDRRYRNLLFRQRGIQTVIVLMLGGFIVLTGYGLYTMRLERVQEYNQLVEEQSDRRNDGEYGHAEELFYEASQLMPSESESYYQQAVNLYEQGEYQKCIDFIEYDIFQNEKLDKDDRRTDSLCLKAECCLELEKYEQAVEAFEEAFEYPVSESVYYRDYAIALAYSGNSEMALEILDEAVNIGLDEDSVYYARGEIESSLGEYETAANEFGQCITVSGDEELRMRAYISLSKIYEKLGDKQTERSVLLEARESLSKERQMVILERLIQADIELADSGQTELLEEAAQALQEIITQGWETYVTYDNLAVVYQKQGNIEMAGDTLDEMSSLYGDDYNIEKRRAFLEVDRQESKRNEERDYTAFASYYQKASQMYYEQLENNDTDAEMELLDNVYQQVVNGGWLE